MAVREQAAPATIVAGRVQTDDWLWRLARAVTWEMVAYAAIIGVAFALRIWDLGWKILHHDESLHAVYSHYLYASRGYTHNPMMHGPWQFHAGALSYTLFGASDFTARLPHAIFGTLLVWLPWTLRDLLGRTGALATALLLALSPGFLYFSRFAREDAFAIFWSALMVVAVWRYLTDRRDRWLYVAAGATSFMFATKENSYIIAGILLLYLLARSVYERRLELVDALLARRPVSAAGDLVILLSTLILPFFAAFAVLPSKVLRTPEPSDTALLLVVFALMLIGAVVGLRWDARRWLVAAAIFWVPFFLLHTTFFANMNGFYTGTVGGLKYWVDQQGVARGNQPWFYYFLLLGLYEFVALGLGIWGVVRLARPRIPTLQFLGVWGTATLLAAAIPFAFKRFEFIPFAVTLLVLIPVARSPRPFPLFLVYWIALTLALYIFTSEKMPWLLVHVALPFVLLGGLTLGEWIEGKDWRALFSRGLGWFLGLFALLVGALIGFGRQAASIDASSQIALQRSQLGVVFTALVVVALAALAVRSARAAGRAVWAPALVGVIMGVGALLSVRAAFQLSYFNPDIPVEMAVYTQSSPDVRTVVREIEDVAFRLGQDERTFRVGYGHGVSWPMAWYLRDYKNLNFFGSGTPANDAVVVMVGTEDGNDVKMRNFLGNKYVSQRYRLRWWFPEDYRSLSPGDLLKPIYDPAARSYVFNYFMNRQITRNFGSSDFVFFVRRDVAAGAWLAPQAAAQAAVAAAQSVEPTLPVKTDMTVGGTQPGAAPGQFNDPKGIAIGRDGRIYVADTRNHRVQILAPDGKPLAQIGQRGQADGEFNEPWGVAVDAENNIYVADTWNHRVQKFDPGGKFLLSWGQLVRVPNARENPTGFFGPRGIAVSPAGQVFIADTGNHRVIRFDKDGKNPVAIGGRGSDPGFFHEPVGLVLDQAGNLYVADTWNQRIQKLDPALKPLTSFPAPSWQEETPTNKPYLAVDASGTVYVTDPDRHQVLVYNAAGQRTRVLAPVPGETATLRLPSGIAVDPTGRAHLTDSQQHRVVRLVAS